MLQINQILHSSVIVSDTQKALAFYCNVLGLNIDESRPQMSFAGAWLKVGEQQIHLLELPNPDPVNGRPEHGGRDRHVALAVNDIELLQQRLEQARLPYTRSKSGRNALFVRDPDGNALEFIEV
ncbi:MAG: VOC family protein [Gammaproteobacteria bacterium]|jgi:glyoxylase I family protein